MSGNYSARITAAIHALALKLEAAIQSVADYTHDLHGLGLQNAYNEIAKEASLLREKLTKLGQQTRDDTIQAKIDYQKALAAAEASFNARLAAIQSFHTTQREQIVAALDGTNGAARIAADAVAAHDEAR